MKSLLAIACGAALLCACATPPAPGPAPAAAPASAPAPAAAAKPAEAAKPVAAAKGDDPDAKVCRSVVVTGSQFRKRTCMTRTEWAVRDEANRIAAKHFGDATKNAGAQ